MTIPLYQDHQAPENKNALKHPHAGLWFDRFFNGYEADWQLSGNAKKDWINTLSGSVGHAEQLEVYCQRQTALVKHLKGQSERFTSDWHWVNGMGNPHPVENGLSWHPTLGIPYLAGSAVKGLVRAWVELNDDGLLEEAHKARLKSWFGTEKKGDIAEQAGNFIFFDAIPDQCPTLMTDIMTPHMGDWYAEGDKAQVNKPKTLPADWHEPIPIPFLAVKHIALIFSIAPRRPEHAEQLTEVFAALEQALAWLGAGAKTATGYGYMSKDAEFAEQLKKQQAQAEQQQRLAKLSPQRRQVEQLRQILQEKQQNQQKETISGPFYQQLKQYVDQAEKEWPTEDRQALYSVAKDIINFLSDGKKPSRKAKQLLNNLHDSISKPN